MDWKTVLPGKYVTIYRDPGAASRDDVIFPGESLLQERESPWALTLTEPVPEAFEFLPADWPEKYRTPLCELSAGAKSNESTIALY